MKTGAIFDMDGLLLDTERLYQDSWVVLAEQFGQIPNPKFPKAVCGTNGTQMQQIIREYYPEIDETAFMNRCIERVEQLLQTDIPEKPGMREILQFLRDRGVRIAVASSSKCKTIESNLLRIGVMSYFDAVVSGEHVEHGKPAPDIFLLAADRLGCAPEDCYVFEDGVNGIRAGVAAGCATIMIPDLTPPTKELHTVCTGIFCSLSDAMQAIAQGEI